ncbi:Na+/H+ antiporter subunit E [Oerskovia enterophila]|uniref:Monovalent cation/H+ antiporter subunit E n=1 Tax=Oerskovia enterophila TaxID=43678 RepID=A0A163Q6F7_9CELL|nr:Na+/H+ antiporter subunit E [Oerskovia enterophila]KZM33841.1 putative monovalent cation/H+ antiporter subunit E [Oerskovia enterophila]OCI33219.1 putative monovalent cation/H+ antiporter subunit E [Oerskovia enterophila]
MSLHRRRGPLAGGWFGRLTAQWRTVAWLTVVWVMLWGDLSWGNVIAGVIIASLLITFMPLPSIATSGTVRPWPLLVLVSRFVADLVVASFQVSMQAFRFHHTPHGAVVGVRLRNPSDIYMTITAELSSLVPGSLVIEAHRLTGMLYLHVLDLDAAGGADKVRQDTLDLEARVLRAFASNEELKAAGLYHHPGEPSVPAGASPSGTRGADDAARRTDRRTDRREGKR